MLENLLTRFRSLTTADPSRQRLVEIERIDWEVQHASLDRRAQLFNSAADLCLQEGEYLRALRYFGCSIDAYLEAGHHDAAPALCRKVIRLVPDVVRTRSTLASISLAKGMFRDAEEEIAEYVRAAAARQQEELAAKRLRLMGIATEHEQIRMQIGEYLLELGDPVAADTIFGRVYAERNGLRPLLSEDEEERWGRLLPVALMGPTEMLRLEAEYDLR